MTIKGKKPGFRLEFESLRLLHFVSLRDMKRNDNKGKGRQTRIWYQSAQADFVRVVAVSTADSFGLFAGI